MFWIYFDIKCYANENNISILNLIICVDSPLSLQSQCRLTVRRALGGCGVAGAGLDLDLAEHKQTNRKIMELGETTVIDNTRQHSEPYLCVRPWP